MKIIIEMLLEEVILHAKWLIDNQYTHTPATEKIIWERFFEKVKKISKEL